jgi:hypothetical protein
LAQTKKKKQKAFVPDPKILVWTSQNRGIVRRTAEKVGVSEGYVSMILSGRRKSEGPAGDEIVAALKKAGAPLK